MALRTSNDRSVDPGPAAQPNVNNDTATMAASPASLTEQTCGVTAPPAGTSLVADQAFAIVTPVAEGEQAVHDERVVTPVVHIATITRCEPGSTREDILAFIIGHYHTCLREVAARQEAASRACEANSSTSATAISDHLLAVRGDGYEYIEDVRLLFDGPIHSSGGSDGGNEESTGHTYSGGNSNLTGPVHSGGGDNRGLISPVHGVEADIASERGLGLVEVGKIGVGFLRRAMLKRFWITGSISVAIILITASALKAAGYASRDIQWPITLEVMVATIFLAPTYANIIA
ncbi:hypothetical protein F4802DRAFT_566262 [Xylaria palmicola]|nr:hypothetical protein F4802DRAFT_566262 [Xylaria palmicola]